MSEQDYTTISPEDQKKAVTFFEKARSLGQAGQYDYAIEMFLSGLGIDPESTDAHKDLRDLSLKRKASGGKGIGMFAAMKLKGGKDAKEAMLNAEKLLAYDPGERTHMLTIMQQALKGGFFDTVMWVGQVLIRANKDSGKEDIKYYLAARDAFRQLKRWKEAVEACQYAAALRPQDMDLQTELKHLGAQHTMHQGGYASGGSFRDSVKDMDKQRELMVGDSDVRTGDMLTQQIVKAEAEWQAEPNEGGKLMRLVELLVKSEDPERENRAIELLEGAFERTKQYRFRKTMGDIKVSQLSRMERSLRQQVAKNPNDARALEDYKEFHKDRLQQELSIYQEQSAEYPTDSSLKYQVAKRLFELGRHDEAIPLLQEVRNDPKYRVDATIDLGRAFMDAGFADEAVDTLKDLVESYQLKGDEHAINIYYYYGRSLESKGDVPAAIKAYSQVAQWRFNFRDVQQRIKKLRATQG